MGLPSGILNEDSGCCDNLFCIVVILAKSAAERDFSTLSRSVVLGALMSGIVVPETAVSVAVMSGTAVSKAAMSGTVESRAAISVA